ncbi:SusC/RagA family TonB-linked outer membrane protein [Marinoscillum furvescens]|uniref:TonB-linked SusC/RagA family outer membrane protein n=1 Tax=Marinoscillum furvescens DSM 4134 TaxID=1122208 RepID=A0A3D9L2Z1_MARFU|nr:TonB-dependent receptor [Marinoscillum furvescens]RED98354.1 TonB-linked SusC/RagA family outer membrane protein [Marinoscillum furvescens DSM 4134]
MGKNYRILFLLGLMLCLKGYSQEVQVKGKVTSSSGEELPGVTVIVENKTGDGATSGTITDINGSYSLKADVGSILQFSFVGFLSKSIEVKSQTNIDVTLEEDLQQLNEVVVVGYGEQKKKTVVGAIESISTDKIVTSPTSNLQSGLAGKIPGMTIQIKDGELGSENVQMLIRGQATLNNSAPLVLVDNVERSMNNLDPYEIESISVLKDASATAIFGVRGANGVILITTKKGTPGKAKVTANVNYSLQAPTRLPQPLDAVSYMTLRNEVIEQHNDATGQSNPLEFGEDVFQAYENNILPEYYVDRNFYDEFLHDYVPMLRSNVNISGGSDKVKYFTSIGYLSQGGPFKTEKWDEYNYDNEQRLNRLTYRANIDFQVTKGLKAWLNLSGFLQDKNDPIVFGANQSAATTASFYFLQMASFADIPAISYPDLNSLGQVVSVAGQDRTPYGNLNRTGYRVTTTNSLNTSIGLEQNLNALTKGLSARVLVSYDANASHIRGFRRTYLTYNASIDDTGGESVVNYTPAAGADIELVPVLTQGHGSNFDMQSSLNYKRSFGIHDVTGQFMYLQSQRTTNIQVPFNYVGLVGRMTYGYDSRYLAEMNFGMNGSEQFAKGRRFGFFPSVSLGWVLSEEGFMKNQSLVEFLKVRGSYGIVGNDKISNSRFLYVGDWTQGQGNYFAGLGGVPGLPNPVYQRTIPNELVTWEEAAKTNIGLDLNLRGGIRLDADVFYEKRNSILINNSPIPSGMFGQQGLPPLNEGVMENKGFEVALGYDSKLGQNGRFSTTFTTSFARNKVINYNEVALDADFAYRYRVEGYSRGTAFGYHNLGYFESQEEIDGWADQSGLGGVVRPGDLKYEDLNGDGIIDVRDQKPMDYPNVPELNLSYSLSANYKGFDMSLLFHGVTNYSFDISGRGVYDWNGNAYGNYKNYFEHHQQAWSEERRANGEKIVYPRLHFDGVSVSKQPSDYWIQNLWFVRLRNIEFGYTISKQFLSPTGIDQVRVFFNGQNLFLWDNMKYDVMDPEVSNSLSHPIFKTFNIGANITF